MTLAGCGQVTCLKRPQNESLFFGEHKDEEVAATERAEKLGWRASDGSIPFWNRTHLKGKASPSYTSLGCCSLLHRKISGSCCVNFAKPKTSDGTTTSHLSVPTHISPLQNTVQNQPPNPTGAPVRNFLPATTTHCYLPSCLQFALLLL